MLRVEWDHRVWARKATQPGRAKLPIVLTGRDARERMEQMKPDAVALRVSTANVGGA